MSITEFPDGIKIGGVSLVPTEGTRGTDKRLRFIGDEGNSCELELVPGKNAKPEGVQSQVILYAVERPSDKGYSRVAISLVGNSDGIGEDCVIDTSTSGGRRAVAIIWKFGGDALKNFGGFTGLKMYWDGTIYGIDKHGDLTQLSWGKDAG